MSELIKAEASTLAGLLRQGCFNVPRHQRYYDWEGNHVTMLLDDLAESISQNSPCHFLGSIMLIKSAAKNKWEINDGQQRIITFSLICAYLCRIFHDQGLSSEVNHIIRILFSVQEAHNNTLQDADNLSPRVTPPRDNKTNFNNLIRGRDVGANGKMVLAWRNIVSFFEQAEHQKPEWRKKILNFMLNNVFVVRLEVDKSLDENAIFETLNYRGKHLDQVDLIKNYFLSFFSNAPAQSDTVYDNLEKIYASFPDKVAAEYARCCMQAKYGFINKEQFFRKTKNRFGNTNKGKSKEVFELVNDLSKKEKIQIFKTFWRKSSNQEFLQRLTQDARKVNNKRKIDDYLLDLHDYKITRPLTFALLCRYSSASQNNKIWSAKFVYDCVKLLSSFVQRVTHIGNFRPSVYEAKFADLAKIISDGSCTTPEQFFDYLKTYDNAAVIDDTHYIEQIKTRFYSHKSITKSGYILRKIVEHQEKGVRIDGDQVSVEHILPRSNEHNSKSSWTSTFDQNDRDRFVHCLGNLTLLSRKDNSPKAGDNESFSVKKKIYATSSYQVTRDICQYTEWTPKAIKRRQSELAKIAAKQIWNFRLN